MQTAGNLVDLSAELTAGVQGGHHGLESGLAGAWVLVDRDAPAVVADRDGAVLGDVDPNAVAVPRHRFVDAVVGDLDEEVMEAALVGAADVHTGAAAHRLQAFEDLDITGRVLLFRDLSASCHDERYRSFRRPDAYLTSSCVRTREPL